MVSAKVSYQKLCLHSTNRAFQEFTRHALRVPDAGRMKGGNVEIKPCDGFAGEGGYVGIAS